MEMAGGNRFKWIHWKIAVTFWCDQHLLQGLTFWLWPQWTRGPWLVIQPWFEQWNSIILINATFNDHRTKIFFLLNLIPEWLQWIILVSVANESSLRSQSILSIYFPIPKFQADHPHHDEGSGYNVTGSSWTQAERQSNSELIIRLWCTRVTPRSCSRISKDWRGIGPCCASSGITSENPEISLAGVFSRRRAVLKIIPFGQTFPSEEGFLYFAEARADLFR